MDEADSTANLERVLSENLKELQQTSPDDPKLLRKLCMQTFKKSFIAIYLLALIPDLILIAVVVMQKEAVDLWFDNDEGTAEFFILCAFMTLCIFVYSVLTSFQSFLSNRLGICITKGIHGLVLQKILTLSHKSLSEVSSGRIVSLVANDSDFVMDYFSHVTKFAQGVIMLIVGYAVLAAYLQLISLFSLIGLAIPFILVPVFNKVMTR